MPTRSEGTSEPLPDAVDRLLRLCPRIRPSRLLLVHRLRRLPRIRDAMSAVDLVKIAAFVAALAGIGFLLGRWT